MNNCKILLIDRVNLEKQTIRLYSPQIDKWFIQPFPEIKKSFLAERIKERSLAIQKKGIWDWHSGVTLTR
ncbi:MAG: hypothetical protein Q8933_05240 [Bacteroidota bacterium]|nr:hypothetical protein [Bacteroidota bacterium]MDP4192671.1 hypothetical protein [Bacteroidota bacterium]MDP4195750.1 hypothetical protein [Bacteroidota bacterium]